MTPGHIGRIINIQFSFLSSCAWQKCFLHLLKLHFKSWHSYLVGICGPTAVSSITWGGGGEEYLFLKKHVCWSKTHTHNACFLDDIPATVWLWNGGTVKFRVIFPLPVPEYSTDRSCILHLSSFCGLTYSSPLWYMKEKWEEVGRAV